MEAEVNSPMVELAPGESYAMDTRVVPDTDGRGFQDCDVQRRCGNAAHGDRDSGWSGTRRQLWGVLCRRVWWRTIMAVAAKAVVRSYMSVTPVEPVQLQITLQAPPNTSRVSVHLVDSLGVDRGPLGEVLVNPPPWAQAVNMDLGSVGICRILSVMECMIAVEREGMSPGLRETGKHPLECGPGARCCFRWRRPCRCSASRCRGELYGAGRGLPGMEGRRDGELMEKLEIIPELGGRLMQVTFGGHDYLFVNSQLKGKIVPIDPSQHRWVNYGGDKIWPMPEGSQDEQHWAGAGGEPLDDAPFRS